MKVDELALWRGAGFAHRLIDVRRSAKRTNEGDQIPGSQWLDPASWLDWKDGVASGTPVVVYCAHGHELSQAMAACLRALGHDARHLDGGIEAWRQAGREVESLRGG